MQLKRESQELYVRHARFEMPLDIQVKMSRRQLNICVELRGKVRLWGGSYMAGGIVEVHPL